MTILMDQAVGTQVYDIFFLKSIIDNLGQFFHLRNSQKSQTITYKLPTMLKQKHSEIRDCELTQINLSPFEKTR